MSTLARILLALSSPLFMAATKKKAVKKAVKKAAKKPAKKAAKKAAPKKKAMKKAEMPMMESTAAPEMPASPPTMPSAPSGGMMNKP